MSSETAIQQKPGHWPTQGNTRWAIPLETLVLTGIPDEAVPYYEAALESLCRTVGYFREPPLEETWRLEGVWEQNGDEAALSAALALAAAVSGFDAGAPERHPTEAEGWLARTVEAFPEQALGRRFTIRPTHLPNPRQWDRLVLRLDAGLAFGSGEHESTRGCLLAFEAVAHRRPRRILDLGTGSGILGMAAAKLLHRKVLATDIEPWSVRVAAENGVMNGLRGLFRAELADGWRDPVVRTGPRWQRPSPPPAPSPLLSSFAHGFMRSCYCENRRVWFSRTGPAGRCAGRSAGRRASGGRPRSPRTTAGAGDRACCRCRPRPLATRSCRVWAP